MVGKMFPFINAKPWNPLGGECLHSCRYCWVENLKKLYPALKAKYSGTPRIIEHELKRISQYKAGDFAFVCDCTDLFGHWVPTEYIQRIFEAMKNSPAKFLLLTKNPKRYRMLISIGVTIPSNCVLGATIESDKDHLLSGPPESQRLEAITELKQMGYPTMISVEPVLDFTDDYPFKIIEAHPDFIAVGYDNYNHNLPEPRLSLTEALARIVEDAKITVYRKTMRHPFNSSAEHNNNP